MGKTKRIFLAILLLLIACNGWAATTFNDTTADHKWSTVANWSDGIPDSADDVTINAAVTSLIIDATAECLSADFTGTTSPLTVSGSGNISLYGNLKLSSSLTGVAGVTWTHTGDVSILGTSDITTAGVSLETSGNWTINTTGTVKIATDASSTTSDNLKIGGTFTLAKGTLNLNARSLFCHDFVSTGAETRVLQGGSATGIILTGLSGTLLDFSTTTNLTVQYAPNIHIGSGGRTLSGNVTIKGGGKTFGNLVIRRHAGNYSTIIEDSNTWGNILIETPNATYQYNKVAFEAGETQTLTSLTSFGNTLYKNYIQSTSAGTAAILSDTSGINAVINNIIQDITVSGGAIWGAGGATNTNTSGNTGWVWDTASYYVSPDGNDSTGDGSEETPWLTISKVQSAALPGDTVYFASQGTWEGSNPILVPTPGVTYDGSTYGTGTRAKLLLSGYTDVYHGVVDISYPYVTLRGIEIDGSGDGARDCDLVQLGGYSGERDIEYVTIDDCIIHNLQVAGGYSNGVSLGPRADLTNGVTTPHTISNITITDTTVYDTVNANLSIYPIWQCNADSSVCNGNKNDTILVRNCTFYNDDDVGINIKSGSNNVTVEFCNIHSVAQGKAGANGAGIYAETSTYDPLVAPQNLIIRYNLIHDNGVRGIGFKNKRPLSWDVSIYGNILWDNGRTPTGGSSNISFGGDDWGSSVFNIYNNTMSINTSVVNSSYPRNVVLGTGSTNSGGVTGTPTINFKNNIIYQNNCDATTKTMIIDVGQKLIHGNNLIYCGTGETGYKVCSGVDTFYRTNTQVQTWEGTAQVTDPSFTAGDLPTGFSGTYGTDLTPNQTYFSITSGDALGNGAVLASDYNKAINNAGTDSTYTRGTAWDIGAYEYTLDGGATIVNTGAVFSGCTF